MNIKKIIIFLFIINISICEIYAQKSAISSFADTKGIVYDFCFSKGGTLIAVPQGNDVNVYETKSQTLLYKLSGGCSKQILSIDISADSSYLVTGSQDSLVVLWDLKTQTIVRKLNFHKGVVSSVKFNPARKEIASGSSDNSVVLYNYETDSISFKFTEHSADVGSVAYNIYGDVLASASEDKTIIFHKTGTGEFISKITAHKGFVRQIKFSSDNTRLISCDDKSRVIIWKVENLNAIMKLNNQKESSNLLLSVDIHNENQIFATGGLSGKLKIETGINTSTYNVKKIIHKVLFVPNQGVHIKIAVATRGMGVLIIDTSK